MIDSSDLPLSCASRGHCMGALVTIKHKDEELQKAGLRQEQVESRVRDLETAALLRTASAELTRATERIRELQERDVTQRKTIDALSGETYELRNIMRAKGIDMEKAHQTVSEALLGYIRATDRVTHDV